jgi:hypothetical protein
VASPGQAVAVISQTQQGVPYSWAGGTLAGPSLGSGTGAGTVGFDCSGLVLWAFGQLGIALPHYTGAQWALGAPVAQADLRPGDVVFFEPDKSGIPQHEGVYLGSGKFEAAPHTGAKVATFSLADRNDYVGARRYVPDASVNRNGNLVPAAAGYILPADSTALTNAWKAAVNKLNSTGSGGGLAGSALGFLGDVTGVTAAERAAGYVSGAAGSAASAAAGAAGSVVGDLNPANIAKDAVSAALGPIGSAITGVEQDLVGRAAHAGTWILLTGFSVTLIYLGAKRAIAPNGPGISDLAKLGATAAA